MMALLLMPFPVCFVLTLLLQMFLCFKIEKGVWKALPLVIDLLVFFYAGARFLGVISYASDTTGIYDGGFTNGVYIGIMAFIALISIVLAWMIYYFIGWSKTHSRS